MPRDDRRRAGYAFPHADGDESRRFQLLEERLDPTTIRRIERLGLVSGARSLEVGAGRGSIARWLCGHVGPGGRVTATDLETDFLAELSLPNLEVLRHDVRIDEFPERTFDLIHARTVLMHLPERMATLRRMVSWLAPGGWLLVEDADFGMWMGDADPIWAAHPRAWHEAFPNGSLSHVIRANGHAVQYRDRGVAGDDHGGTTGSSKLGGHSCGGVSLASLRPVDVVDVASVQTGGSPLRRSFRKAGPNLPTHSSCGCSL